MASTFNSMLITAAFLLLAMLASQATARKLDEVSMTEKHEQWMAQHGRVYKDEAEKAKRFKIFKETVEYIEAFNKAGNKSYVLGINQFADMTNEEFLSTSTGYKPRKDVSRGTSFRYADVSEVPPSMDWRKKGAVTDVKDQQTCGCCWAFSAAAAVEGIHLLKTGDLISLSEQELVDCVTDNYGCGGGFMDTAFKFIVDNGLAAESAYPYQAADGTCNRDQAASPAARITGYDDVPQNNEDALLQAAANQPVSVGIDGSDINFRNYQSGILTGECGTEITHAVTLVGYGTSEDGTKYWLIKNSWGTSWGEGGYMRIQRDIDAPEGLCGIAKLASYPTA